VKVQEPIVTNNNQNTTGAPFSASGRRAGDEGIRLAFKMHLHPGFEIEYKKRHDEIWPELVSWLKENGISDYSIFLDEETHTLFAVLRVTDAANMANVPNHPVMQRWWDFMKDVMASHADSSPVSVPLKEVFYLP
jgi:L-rhamnose mutarotase